MTRILSNYRVASSLLFGLLLLSPLNYFAQPNQPSYQRLKKNELTWGVRIYPKKPHYLEVFFDTRDLEMQSVSTDVLYTVYFYDKDNGFLGKKEFTVPNEKFQTRNKLYRTYEKIPFSNVRSVIKGNARYNTTQNLLAFHYTARASYCRSSQASRDSGSLKEGEKLHTDWDLLNKIIDGQLDDFPYLIRKSNGKIRPPRGYEWVSENDQNDLRIQLLPGLVADFGDSVRPMGGYRWVYPFDHDNFQVELIPGLVKAKEGGFRPSSGYDWVDSKDPRNFCVKPI